MTRVCIAGAGIAGTYLAIALARRGIAVCLMERRRPDPASGRLGDSGRSIALALSHRGLHALAQLGLEANAERIGRPLQGRRIHAPDGSTAFTAYDPTGRGRIYAISRAELYGLLHDAAAAEPGIQRRFGEGLADWWPDADGGVWVAGAGGAAPHRFDALIGADGADSSVRHGLEAKGLARFVRRDFPLVYRELALDANGPAFDRAALHIWPRGELMLIGLPGAAAGGFDGTLFLPEAADAQWFGSGFGLAARFAPAFPDVDCSERWAAAQVRQPRGRIYTIEGGPWHAGAVGLVGDAAHAITPFLGQGMNCALEDCQVLLQALDEGSGFAAAFEAFSERRAADAQAIARLSVANLEEMMVQTQSPEYLQRKAMESVLATRYPQAYLPCYSAITFGHVRYSRVLRLRQLQDALLDRLRRAGLDAAALRQPGLPWLDDTMDGYGRDAARVLSE